MMINEDRIREIADDAKQAYKNCKVLWFKHPTEIRVVFVTPESVPYGEDERDIAVFYILEGEATAMCRPEEVGKLFLPETWGAWKDGVEP